jgi:glucose/arabinose dehydrogenase
MDRVPARHDTHPGWLFAAVASLMLVACGGGDEAQSTNPPVLPPTPPIAPTLAVTRVFAGLPAFAMPVAMLQPAADATRWYVVEQSGRVRSFANDSAVTATSVFIDLSTRIVCCGETGLLGMAFHPSYPADPRVFLYYTVGSPLRVRLAAYRTRDGGVTLDATSEQVLLTATKPESNHNGGHIAFGPDGLLYIGVGDGGGGGDAHGAIGNGQNTQTLLGKILRIDVNSMAGGLAYAIPPGNPFAANAACGATGSGSSACAEIYAWGLRNPWRFSFDRVGGALWIGDVGQNLWEEVDRINAPANLGWRCREASHAFNAACGPGASLVDPVAEYAHSVGQSITGGFVYRGALFPVLRGRYVFGDFVTGRLWSIPADSSGTLNVVDGVQTGLSIASFGEGNDGEIHVIDYAGALYRLTAS